MWPDNEAEVDLLGFEFLVDGLFYALTQPQLLPLTCGLLGDWGSGKSSVLGLLRDELERERPDGDSPSRFLCVTFSPWQHEGYDDVKAALINAVLDVLAERAAGHPELSDKVSFLRRCARGFARWSRKAGRGALAVGPSALPWVLQAAQPDLDPTAADAIKDMTSVAAGAASQRLAEPAPDTGAPDTAVITTAAEFRDKLVELIEALPGLDALVVLVDDMDRCLPDTVVDTFEAIRIFVGTHKTAYVIAANEDIVQSAVDARYRQLINDGVGLGARYLEKMLQIRLRIPALSGVEADTYTNLLLAQLHLQPHQFDLALAHVRERRAAGHLDVEFTLGVCFELFSDETPPPLVDDLTWAHAISPVLAGGLRGNPRELKRFLNSLMLRHGSARRRGVELRRQVLAKLMVLEEQHPPDFRQLYAWQCLAHGPVPELVEAEAKAGVHTATSTSAAASTDALDPPDDADPATNVHHGTPSPQEGIVTGTDDVAGAIGERVDAGPGGAGPGDEADDAVAAWAAKDHVSAWLALSPSLADVDLRPYFAYARDRLVPGTGAATLSADLQLLLTRLQGDAKAVREQAGRQVSTLSPAQRQRLIETLLDALARQPSGPAFRAALDLLEHSDDALEPVTASLMRLPTAAVPAKEVPNALARLRGRGEHADAVVERWANSDSAQLAAAVTTLRGAGDRGRQRGGRCR